MAILDNTDLTSEEHLKIANNLKLTETEAIESEMILEQCAEHEQRQKQFDRKLAFTIIIVTGIILLLFGITAIFIDELFPPQH